MAEHNWTGLRVGQFRRFIPPVLAAVNNEGHVDERAVHVVEACRGPLLELCSKGNLVIVLDRDVVVLRCCERRQHMSVLHYSMLLSLMLPLLSLMVLLLLLLLLPLLRQSLGAHLGALRRAAVANSCAGRRANRRRTARLEAKVKLRGPLCELGVPLLYGVGVCIQRCLRLLGWIGRFSNCAPACAASIAARFSFATRLTCRTKAGDGTVVRALLASQGLYDVGW